MHRHTPVEDILAQSPLNIFDRLEEFVCTRVTSILRGLVDDQIPERVAGYGSDGHDNCRRSNGQNFRKLGQLGVFYLE